MTPYCDEHQMYHDDPYQCDRMAFAARREAREAVLREKAERIAEYIEARLEVRGSIEFAGLGRVPTDRELRLEIATAAALAALTEKENAR